VENEWLAAVKTELERATGTELGLTRDEIDELLRLASFAAHESGAKLNAPLLCYLVGRAREASALTVAELAEGARNGAPAAATADRA
jgi:hypothetical protein